jgi:exodeoxyribonuclease-5
VKRVAVVAPEGLDFTAGQTRAAALATRILYTGGILVIRGYAGTGKSVLLAAIVESLLDSGQRADEDFVVACPTGRAAARLRELGVRCARTIHSFLYVPVVDRLGNLMGFRLRTIEDLPARFALLLDESSMISPAVLSDLYDLVTPTLGQRSIVAIGDSFQLPPVLSAAEKEKYGAESIFDEDLMDQLSAERCSLTEVVRQQAGSPIIALATALRSSTAPPPADWQKVTIVRDNRDKAEDWMRVPDFQVLTWRNQDRHELNTAARKQRDYSPARPFEPGERLVVTHNHREANLCNGDLVDLLGLGSAQRWHSGTTYAATIRSPLDTAAQECSLLLQTAEQQQDGLSWPARAQKIKRESGVLPILVDYGYALTCHKAQGSEWPTVGVYAPDTLLRVMDETEAHRWLYTAVTRAKDRLFFVGGGELAALLGG